MWLVTKPRNELFNYFKPDSYALDMSANTWQLIITGRKTGPPSHRITLHQKGLKIVSAEIVRQDKTQTGFNIERINHLTSFEQVRLHTTEIQYPGVYQIRLSFTGGRRDAVPGRELMPSIDELAAWEKASLEIKQ